MARFEESLYGTTLKNGIYICTGALLVYYLVVVFYVRCQPIETNKMLLRLRSLFRSANIFVPLVFPLSLYVPVVSVISLQEFAGVTFVSLYLDTLML